ncbi:hypothetical protein SPD48_11300 [Pseudogracilibacillus sp. SE30717A]|uniref:hypothetical protein n=1 Tax=Pseudogracilibacillus sp. SE30717A TaxID=3098293 RepID=UPI00300E1A62
MNQSENEVNQVAEKRLGLVIGVHVLSLLAAAAFPEGRPLLASHFIRCRRSYCPSFIQIVEKI